MKPVLLADLTPACDWKVAPAVVLAWPRAWAFVLTVAVACTFACPFACPLAATFAFADTLVDVEAVVFC